MQRRLFIPMYLSKFTSKKQEYSKAEDIFRVKAYRYPRISNEHVR